MTFSISKLERLLLLTFTFAGFLFFALAIVEPIVREYNWSVYEEQRRLLREANNEKGASFSISCSGWTVPGFHLISFFILVSLIRTKKFIVSLFLTKIYLIFFTYSIYLSKEYLFSDSLTGGVGRIFESLYYFDYVGAFFILILLFWQSSILLRMLIKNIQRKNVLP